MSGFGPFNNTYRKWGRVGSSLLKTNWAAEVKPFNPGKNRWFFPCYQKSNPHKDARNPKIPPYGGFLKWWYPATLGFSTKNDHFGVFWGYHHLRKHPYRFQWRFHLGRFANFFWGVSLRWSRCIFVRPVDSTAAPFMLLMDNILQPVGMFQIVSNFRPWDI